MDVLLLFEIRCVIKLALQRKQLLLNCFSLFEGLRLRFLRGSVALLGRILSSLVRLILSQFVGYSLIVVAVQALSS